MNQALYRLHRAADATARRPLRPASQLLPLEQRFMFDGAAAGALADAAHAAHAHDSAALPLPPAVMVRAADPSKDGGKKEVALVDTSVANYQSLEAGVRAGVGIVEFDGSRDGLAQIAQWAAGQSGLDAIHILSHGSEGVLNLGNDALTVAALGTATTQAELAQLGHALSPDGDLLLYGCDVAAGADGAQLLAGIAKASGADVAASTDVTGAARLGGDWTLEAHDGKIEARALELANYDGALSVITLVYGTDGDENTYKTSISKTETTSGKTITFSGPDMTILNYGGPDDGLYPWDGGGGNAVQLTIAVQAGYSFDINSIGIQAESGTANFAVTWADGTSSSFTQSGLNVADVITPVSNFATALNDIRSVTITSTQYSTFQSFNISDVKLLPAAPSTTVATAHLSADSGTSGSDYITNTAAQTISGTLSANLAAGERVEVSYDNGAHWSNATDTVGLNTWSANTTLAGSNTFEARVTNAIGSSSAYTHSYTLDTTAPTTSFSSIALSDDTGASSSDFITRTAAQTISATLSGAPAAGDIVYGSVDGGNSFVDITSKVSGTTLTWTGATLAGTSSIMLKVTDAAGNDSALSFQNYTLDTTAPTHGVATATFSNDSGSSSTDFDTNVASQTISGTLSGSLSSGEQVYVSLDNGGSWLAATDAVGSNAWSLSHNLTASGTLKVKVSDTAGNDGPVLLQAYVYDTTAPTITFSALALSADTGASSSDFITRTAAQTISATLSGAPAAGDIVYGSLDNGGTWTDITSKVSGTALSWNGVTLSGSGTLLLKVSDAAGNDGTPASHGYTLDTSAPATPGTPVLASASDSGASSSDGVTSVTTPALSGTAENGSSVAIYDGATLLGTVTAGAGGWSFTTGALGEGSHSITAIATDAAGNASAASAARSITIDSSAPAVTSVAVPANATYYGGQALDFTVNFSEAVTVDTSGGTPRIAIVVGSATRYADYVSGSGSGALLFRYTVPSGDLDADGISVGALSVNGGSLRDTAGNNAVTTLNSVGSTAGVDVDGTQPSVTGVSSGTADGAYAAGSTITITVDFSGAVTVDTSGGTPTLALAGGGSATYTGGSGSGTLTFSYTVGAGQNSADLDYSSTAALALNGATIVDANGAHPAASLTLSTPGAAGSLGANKDIDIDTTAPTNTVAGASFSADTGTSNSDFVTKTAAQTISGTLSANLAAGEHVYVSLDNGATYALASDSVGSNAWSLAGQTLTGSGTLKVLVIDDAGNAGSYTTHAYVLDTTAPAISFSGIALSADTGASHTDLITNTAAQTISATLSAAPAGSDLVYGSLDNGGSWIDITSKVSGTTLTWNGVTLASSDTLKLRVTDAAGNNGAATSAAYVLDTTAPTNTVATVGFSNDSGASNSDFITNSAAQTVSGTLANNLAAGDAVYVSLDNGSTWSAATTTVGSNAWSLAGQTLTASDTLQVKVSNLAGNDGAVTSQAYVYDTAATVPTVDVLATQSLTPVLTGAATLAAGETMTVTVGGATYAVVPVAGAWSLDLATAVPASGALALVLNNQYEVVATVTDLAGNIASDTSTNELTVGTVAPPATTTSVTGAALSADSGASNSDFITNVAQQTVSGSLSAPLQAGESVLVSVDGGVSWQGASASGRSWSAGVTLSGSGLLEVKITGNGGDGPVYSHNYVLDTTPPAAPTVDALTATTTIPTLTGTATLATGETLTVSVGGASYLVGVSGGSWSLDLAHATPTSGTLALAAGSRYDISATATDLAGNTSRDTAAGVLLIAGKPTTLVTGATLSADSGASGSDFITNVAAQTISGTLSAPLLAGQRVEVSLDGGATWSNTGAATGAAGWSIAVTLSGSNVFMARVNSDGGAGAVSQHAYTLDTTAPLATPVSATLSSGVLSGGLSAPLGAGESVLVSRDNGASWQAASVSGGNWSSPGGANTDVLVAVRDTAGNSGAVLTFSAVTTTPPPDQSTPPVPPVPPVQQVPVVTQPPPAASGASGSSPVAVNPVDAAPDGQPAAGAPFGGAPLTGGPLGVIPSGLTSIGLSGAPVPNAPANPLAPPGIATLTEPAAMLTAFTPNGLPEPVFAGDALLVNTPIADVRTGAGERISVQLAGDSFASTSGGAAFALTAQSADGAPLPVWLKFDAGSARFEGTPPAGFEGTLSFKVTARDAQGRIATQVFKIIVSKDGQAQPVKGAMLDRHWTEPAGRSGLNEQLRSARGIGASAGADRLALLSHSAAIAKAHA